MKNATVVVVSLALGAGFAQAAPTLNYSDVLKLALEKGSDLASQKSTLDTAKANLVALTADSSTLITPLTQAQQSVQLENLRLSFVKLQVVQNVLSAYLGVLEAQENLNVLKAQVDLNQMSLDVAKAKLATKNATQLDVSKAQNTLNSSQQDLKNAQASFPVLQEKLNAYTAGSLPDSYIVSQPKFDLKLQKLDELLKGSTENLPTLLQAMQSVALNTMTVQFSDNDYTPKNTLDSAKASLENAQRNLSTLKTSSTTSIKDAFQSLNNALEKSKAASEDLKTSQATLAQDQVKYKNGQISRYSLKQTETSVLSSEQSVLQAQDSYLKAVASLAVASGTDALNVIGGVE
ncbi:TolC family protein [Deinococcus roseus]|uniref:Transporter n=1 Tax=Deinococcus roseus TaxID=392414 RepID=A0ABQ2DAZ7_9DEIO|nr:TolC family protein [Deinococcus roseus]GGJ51891.1 transporter [Deinococcus roseus]